MFNQRLEEERARRLGHSQDLERFMDPLQRRPDVVANADIDYYKMLRKDAEIHSGPGGKTYWEHETESYNLYNIVHKFVSDQVGENSTSHFHKSILNHQQMIDRCFLFDSVEEIMEALRRESHPFARETL